MAHRAWLRAGEAAVINRVVAQLWLLPLLAACDPLGRQPGHW